MTPPLRSASFRPLGSALALAISLLIVWPAGAAAQDGDGAYGRLDHDTMFTIGLGGGALVGSSEGGVLLLEARARYLDMVGLLVAGEWQVDVMGRVIIAGELRPLWPIRFLLNRFTGVAWLDLFLESLSTEVGVAILPLADGASAGVGLALGLGLDVPILLPGIVADGLVLHLGARHVRSGPNDQAGPPGGVSDWFLHGALVLKLGADLGIAGRELPRYEY